MEKSILNLDLRLILFVRTHTFFEVQNFSKSYLGEQLLSFAVCTNQQDIVIYLLDQHVELHHLVHADDEKDLETPGLFVKQRATCTFKVVW